MVMEVIAVGQDLSRKALGAYGERLAVRDVESKGYAIVDRNWRCREGEIDIVAWADPSTLAFIEVKTRSGTGYGTPAEAVGRTKLGRLRRLAFLWLQAHDLHPQSIRIDVVAVVTAGPDGPSLNHLEGVAL
jgi:putative endonuclease